MKDEVFDKENQTVKHPDKDIIEFDLTDDDVLRLSTESSELNEKLKKLESDFKYWHKRKKEEISAVKSDLDKNFDKIKSRIEEREVDVVVVKDYKNGIISKFHDDNCYQEQNMSEFELRNMPPQLKKTVQEKKDAASEDDEESTLPDPESNEFSTPTKAEPKVHPDQDKIALDSMQSSRDAQDHPKSINVQA